MTEEERSTQQTPLIRHETHSHRGANVVCAQSDGRVVPLTSMRWGFHVVPSVTAPTIRHGEFSRGVILPSSSIESDPGRGNPLNHDIRAMLDTVDSFDLVFSCNFTDLQDLIALA